MRALLGCQAPSCVTQSVKMEDDTLPPSSMVEEEAAEGSDGSDEERVEGAEGQGKAAGSDSSDDEELAEDGTYDTKDGFVVNEDGSDDASDGGEGRCVGSWPLGHPLISRACGRSATVGCLGCAGDTSGRV